MLSTSFSIKLHLFSRIGQVVTHALFEWVNGLVMPVPLRFSNWWNCRLNPCLSRPLLKSPRTLNSQPSGHRVQTHARQTGGRFAFHTMKARERSEGLCDLWDQGVLQFPFVQGTIE